MGTDPLVDPRSTRPQSTRPSIGISRPLPRSWSVDKSLEHLSLIPRSRKDLRYSVTFAPFPLLLQSANAKPLLQNLLSSRPRKMSELDSMRPAIQSCLHHLDRLEGRVRGEIQETRRHFFKLLDNSLLDVATGHSCRYDSTVDPQAEFYELDAIINSVISTSFATFRDRFFVPQPALHSTSSGVTGGMSEGTNPPLGQPLQGKFALFAAIPFDAYHQMTRPITRQHLQYRQLFARCSAFCTSASTQHVL
ncbi:uncharacterized protein HD556DRAFT_588349 [Suillus plorans]|uniref:Uncharacterized protein n=1 Tax=Suillus plorans TaxID=116603 RepID=A0A9P7ANG3_9AGAM|nr:uncharacterized protein HD556DRAFT_588349 [Suillus plorans]KAG1792065.1 hypothetical protein HD556DRAFT_588349 [Suillus plorans]